MKLSSPTILIIIIALFTAPLCYFYPQAYYSISEPVSEISIEINRQADTHGGLAFEEIKATITAYTSGPEETDSESCISASGLNLCEFYYEPYIAIACPLRYLFRFFSRLVGVLSGFGAIYIIKSIG